MRKLKTNTKASAEYTGNAWNRIHLICLQPLKSKVGNQFVI